MENKDRKNIEPREQEYSRIIQEWYEQTESEWSFNDSFLDLPLVEINNLFGKTLFLIMERNGNIDIEKYNKLAIFVKTNVPFAQEEN